MDTTKFNVLQAPKNTKLFCHACLSTDRKLSSIGEYIEIYRVISDISSNVPQSMYVCWECMAVLKKIKHFKAKIQEAQRMLTYFLDVNQKSLLKTLSRLTKIYTEDIIILNHDDETKLVEIKQENDNLEKIIDNDEYHTDYLKEENDNSDTFKDLSLDAIKKENAKEKTTKKNKVSHYKIISKRFSTKKISTQPDVVVIECMCGAVFDTFRKFKAHAKTHNCVQCMYCGAKFLDIASFNSHYRSMHTVFICDHCGKTCKSRHMIEKHMRHHRTTHPCDSCTRSYKSLSALRKHRGLKHCACSAELAYCVVCDKQFNSPQEYTRHVHTSNKHAQETRSTVQKKFPCPECVNVYSRKTYMMNHYRHVHMKQSAYYCSQCDRHFLNRTKYVDHMRYSHEGAQRTKNKLCNICGRGFAANRTLINHIRTHSGERPYECQYCSAKFTQKTSMLSHVKHIHMRTKRKPQWQ